jgi:hypothetical protein
MSANENKHIASNTYQGDAVSIGAASSVTFHMGSGTDTATDRYLGIGEAYGLNLIPTVACSVTEINGRALKVAQSIGVLGWTEDKCKITSFKITAGSATVIELLVKG